MSTIIVVCLFLGAVQLVSLAFIAEYLAKVFEEVKGRPRYVVAQLINFHEPGVTPPPGQAAAAERWPKQPPS